MKLQNKYALYNTFSKILIILALGAFLPSIIDQVAYRNLDSRLVAKKDKVLSNSQSNGLREFMDGVDTEGLGSYNILKEEFISVEPVSADSLKGTRISNAQRMIDEEVFEFRVLSHTFDYNNQRYLLEIGDSLSTINSLRKTLTGLTVGLLLIAVFFAFLMDISFTKFLLLPFNAIIKNKLEQVKHPSSFNFATVKTSTDDFTYLDQSINQMMHKIQDAFLIEKEFIANVSHELLTPISILQTRFENILEDDNLDDKTKLKLIESQKTLSRLNKIVKTLLLISRIENEQYLKQDRIEINELLEDVFAEIEERLTAKNISFKLALKEPWTIEKCNRSLLHTMFFNLINNAIKCNVENGAINVTGNITSSGYMVNITDTGIGIAEENIGIIFDRFRRVGTQEKESYGLGLPIVKTIAQFHGIELKVQSSLGRGATFSLLFSK